MAKIKFFALLILAILISLSVGFWKNKSPTGMDVSDLPYEDQELIKLGLIIENPPEQYKKEFEDIYRLSRIPRQEMFEKYVPLIGLNGVLEVLDQKFPVCHDHELGKFIYSKTNDINLAIHACGTHCTSGCMHGVLMATFNSTDPETLKDEVNTVCNSKSMKSRFGNCVHAFGHAFMYLSQYDIEKALGNCEFFEGTPLQYYCTTGAFMEYIQAKSAELKNSTIHYPCDTYTRFPAACYRYKVAWMKSTLKFELEELAQECLKLEGRFRLGCFHGIGFSYVYEIVKHPEYIAEVCSYGNADDQEICLEGAVEKLAEDDAQFAQSVCEYLEATNKEACLRAVQNNIYSLTKSFRLYFAEA